MQFLTGCGRRCDLAATSSAFLDLCGFSFSEALAGQPSLHGYDGSTSEKLQAKTK